MLGEKPFPNAAWWQDLAEDVKRIGETHTFTSLTPKYVCTAFDSLSSLSFTLCLFIVPY